MAAAAIAAVATLWLLSYPSTARWRGYAESTTRSPASTSPLARTAAVTETTFLPVVIHGPTPGQAPYPHPNLAEAVWRASESFAETYPLSDIYPGYASDGPSRAGVDLNLTSACADFPDLPDEFGPGAHRAACYQWTADYLALFHAVRALRVMDGHRVSQDAPGSDLAWAVAYLDADLDQLERFVFGPEAIPDGVSYRDTYAAVYQNTLRAVDLTITVDILRRLDALEPALLSRVEDTLSGIARAWYASIWSSGVHPNTGVTLTTLTADQSPAYSLAGHQVAPATSYTLTWNADKGNTPAEEAAWQGAGAMLAASALGAKLDDRETLYSAGTHYIDFSLTFGRFDELHGDSVRTLNADIDGAPYGQNQLWVENHAADVPSIPYMAAAWHFVGAAMMAAGDPPRTWPTLTPNEEQWEIMKLSAERTLHAPDGTELIDFRPGNGVGYRMDRHPKWAMPCGRHIDGRIYVSIEDDETGSGPYVSEIGHPAGFDLLLAGWPIMRMAAERGDHDTYRLWDRRLHRVVEEFTPRPPRLEWVQCKVAPYVSANPGYHWSRMASSFAFAYLGLSGYGVETWYPSSE